MLQKIKGFFRQDFISNQYVIDRIIDGKPVFKMVSGRNTYSIWIK